MINANQAIVARYIYDGFGRILAQSGSLAAANVYRFASKELHPNSGLSYFGRRFFDPNLARFINRDPMAEAGGLNLYLYCGNNPLGCIDCLGCYPCGDALPSLWSIFLQNVQQNWQQDTLGFAAGLGHGVAGLGGSSWDIAAGLGWQLGLASTDPVGYADSAWSAFLASSSTPQGIGGLTFGLEAILAGGLAAPEAGGLGVGGAAEETGAANTFFHYTTNPNLEGQGLTVGSGVTSVGDFNAQQAMLNLGIKPPGYVYPVTLDNPLDFLSIDAGTPARNTIPSWRVEVPTPPGSIGAPRPVPPGTP